MSLSRDSSSPNGPASQPNGAASLLSFAGCIVQHSAPLDQPEQVHQITPVLFSQFEVEGGSIALDGCLLEEIPFLRLECGDSIAEGRASMSSDSSADVSPKLQSPCIVLDRSGQQVTEADAQRVGVDYPVALEHAPTYISPRELEHWLESLRPIVDAITQQRRCSIDRVEIVWCKRATGKVSVHVENEEATISFSGWARELANGSQRMPPFRCQVTGREGYRIIKYPSCGLTVPEALKKCAVTGRTCIETELVQCQVTGKLCVPEALKISDWSNRHVMPSHVVECEPCGQRIAKDEHENGVCRGCLTLVATTSEDVELGRLLTRYPILQKWKSWRKGESQTARIFRGDALFKSICLRVGLDSIDLLHVSTKGRLAKRWTKLPPPDWPSAAE